VKGILNDNFEFCNTRNGTIVVTKDIEDFSTSRSHFKSNNFPYFTFCSKSRKPVKDVICHLPSTILPEVFSDGLNLGFDISIKQMSTTHQSPAGGRTAANIPLFLTLPTMSKFHEIFELTNLCYFTIRVEAYKAQTGLMQCYNCQ
jgi:hypothetical protein